MVPVVSPSRAQTRVEVATRGGAGSAAVGTSTGRPTVTSYFTVDPRTWKKN